MACQLMEDGESGEEATLLACRYLRQIAVITPYAEFKFTYTAEDDKSSMRTTFARRTDKMPAPPQACHQTHAYSTSSLLAEASLSMI